MEKTPTVESTLEPSGYVRPRTTSRYGATTALPSASVLPLAVPVVTQPIPNYSMATGYAMPSPVLLEEEEIYTMPARSQRTLPPSRSRRASMAAATTAAIPVKACPKTIKPMKPMKPTVKIGDLEIKEVVIVSDEEGEEIEAFAEMGTLGDEFEDEIEVEIDAEQEMAFAAAAIPMSNFKKMACADKMPHKKPCLKQAKPCHTSCQPKMMQYTCTKPMKTTMCEKPKKKYEIVKTLELPEVATFDVICDNDKRLGLIECAHPKYQPDVTLMPQSDCIDFNHYFNAEAIGQYFYDIRDVASLLVVHTSKPSMCDDTVVTNYFFICPVKICEPCQVAKPICAPSMMTAASVTTAAGRRGLFASAGNSVSQAVNNAAANATHMVNGMTGAVPAAAAVKAKAVDVKLKIKHFCGPKMLRDGIYPVFCSTPDCSQVRLR